MKMVSSTTQNGKEEIMAKEVDDKEDNNNNDSRDANGDDAAEEEEEEEAEAEAEEDEDEKTKEIALFKEGDKVLAYHGPLIYEAKVQKAEIRKKEWKYFVHYLGWSKNWDEWVGPDRLMKITEENVRKQQELIKHTSADKNIRGRAAQNRPRSFIDTRVEKEDVKNYVARGRKRKGDSGAEEKDGESPEKIIKIHLPTTLKKQLVDDWEFVTQLGKLVKLPRNPTVDDILRKYLEHKTKKEGAVGDSVVEILSGVRSYFDKALPSMLLYKQERQQYSDVVPEGNNVAPSTVYGAEHLLRLFVKLPELLVYVNMEEEALATLQTKLLDFLKFLQKNQSSFFLSSYDGPKVTSEVENREQKGS
ncbi:protein MRG1 [Cryptomeria japonica]|uniref:protein MRG1 n=1 Tax=Cryptomeria japonica TaxID=3369 RepID=UPI0027DAA5D8|nr:protein MRG1 [Cryptomeria japonica]